MSQNRRKFLKSLAVATASASVIPLTSSKTARTKKNKFSFAFFTDTHLSPYKPESFKGLKKAIQNVKKTDVDFILTGGDNCDMHGMQITIKQPLEFYNRMKSTYEESGLPVHFGIGNHDRYYDVDKNDPLHGVGLFEKVIGTNSYYSYDYNGWHFIMLDSGALHVDDIQIEWLKKDLASISKNTPIIVVSHVPFFSMYYPITSGQFIKRDVIENFQEIWDILRTGNLKLVLQGHQHIYEEINVKGNQFITAGAICAKWWKGPFHETEEGYLKIDIDKNDNLSWKYIDYGWNAVEGR